MRNRVDSLFKPLASQHQATPSSASFPGVLVPVTKGVGVSDSRDPARSSDQFGKLDIDSGWPPRVLNAQKSKRLEAIAPLTSFSDADRRRSLDIALRHPEVRERLTGRWEALGCDLTYAPTRNGLSRSCVIVCLFNYSDNRMLHVDLADDVVTSIAEMEPWQHPATRIEMAQAISIARAHPDLRDAVSGLEGHAILQVFLEPGHPCFRHRCIDVMFTRPDDPHVEQPVLFKAIIDLSTQSVVTGGPATCGDLSSQ